jgi:hypothetical protein
VNHRATFDQQVIDAWATQVATYRSTTGRVENLLVVALIVALILIFVWLNLFTVSTFVLLGAILVGLSLFEREGIKCPHCNKLPISRIQRGSPLEADFCIHCFYWLKSPYGDGPTRGV